MKNAKRNLLMTAFIITFSFNMGSLFEWAGVEKETATSQRGEKPTGPRP